MQRNANKSEKGITLIALVVTIVVLLILAGVSLNLVLGNNGIISKASEVKIKQAHALIKDRISLEYNDYQIETNTAINKETTFRAFLKSKNCINNEGVIEVKNLTGQTLDYGNGNGTNDVYRLEEIDNMYVVKYYDKDSSSDEIWSIRIEQIELTLEPDTGKEDLILVYEVEANDEVELPYCISRGDTYDFKVEWGDGNIDENITNSNLIDKATHIYEKSGIYEIKIEGIYENLSTVYFNPTVGEYRKGKEKLKQIKQWGTTNITKVNMVHCSNLSEIASPTENSFANLISFSVKSAAFTDIPVNLFANCPNVTSFDYTFSDCWNLESIPENLFANCQNATSFRGTFSDCLNLESIPENLFINCTQVTDFVETFYECVNLKGEAIHLWQRVDGYEELDFKNIYEWVKTEPDGNSCYGGCTYLNGYNDFPTYWTEGYHTVS